MKLLLSTPCMDPTGFGMAGRLYLKALLSVGFTPFLHIPRYTNKQQIHFSDLPPNINDITWNGQYFDTLCTHVTPDIAKTYKNKINTILSVWETNKLPPGANSKVNAFDKLITVSEFSKDAFLNSGVTIPIDIVPHVIQKKEYNTVHSLINKYKDKFVFFSNLEWHLGKGYDVLISAFSKAFEGKKDVILIIKTCSFDVAGKYDKRHIIKKLKGDNEFPKIVLIDDIISEDNLYTLYELCDVYISCSRREAFSLTVGEALSFGKVVMALSYGGHREFLTDKNSILMNSKEEDIDIKLLESSRMLYRGQRWIEPDFDDVVDKMRYAKEERFKPEIDLSDYTFEVIGNKLIKALEL